MATRKATSAADSIGFMLSTLGHAVSRRFIHALQPLELHPREFAVLRAVKANDGQSQQALAERLRIPPSRMVAIVDELESRGLIERRPDPSDRRVRALYVTDRGQTMLEDAFNLVLGHERAISDVLTETERAELLALLNRIATGLGLPTDVHSALRDGNQ
ncbi:MAG TPA: MarR family winged helix-turn-helix transcriptional regulator [Gaiellaceae bacterium]